MEAFRSALRCECGVGLHLDAIKEGKGATILGVVAGGPCDGVGVAVGDLLLEVDGAVPRGGIPRALLVGPPGSNVRLRFQDAKTSTEWEFEILRRPLNARPRLVPFSSSCCEYCSQMARRALEWWRELPPRARARNTWEVVSEAEVLRTSFFGRFRPHWKVQYSWLDERKADAAVAEGVVVGVGAWLRHRATMALDTAQRDILDLVSPERPVAPADSNALTAASQDISKRDCGAAVTQDEAAPENAVMGTSDRRRLHGALSGIAASQCKDEFVFCSSCCASAAATWLSRRVAFELPPRAPTACNGQLYAL